jgi:hypothetical protein
MPIIEQTLAAAEFALLAANDVDRKNRHEAMTRFMAAFELLAREMTAGSAKWEQLRSWAAHHAEPLRAADQALQEWDLETGNIFYDGGEEGAERALERRSRFELVRDLFRGTTAEEMLSGFDAEQVDHDLRAQAEQCGLDPPDWVPPSHTWWLWRKK